LYLAQIDGPIFEDVAATRGNESVTHFNLLCSTRSQNPCLIDQVRQPPGDGKQWDDHGSVIEALLATQSCTSFAILQCAALHKTPLFPSTTSHAALAASMA
jgi:hypothetical protein